MVQKLKSRLAIQKLKSRLVVQKLKKLVGGTEVEK